MVKTEERLENESKHLEYAWREFREQQEDHEETMRIFSSKISNLLRDLETKFDFEYSRRASRSEVNDIQSLRTQLDSIDKDPSLLSAKEGFPLRKSRLQTQVSTLRSSAVLATNSMIMNNSKPRHKLTPSQGTIQNPEIGDSFQDESLSQSGEGKDKAILREMTIIRARLTQKEEDLDRKRADLYNEWIATFGVDDILATVHAHNERLGKWEKQLVGDQEDIDKQKLALAVRLSSLNSKEHQIQTKRDILSKDLYGFYDHLRCFLDNVIK